MQLRKLIHTGQKRQREFIDKMLDTEGISDSDSEFHDEFHKIEQKIIYGSDSDESYFSDYEDTMVEQNGLPMFEMMSTMLSKEKESNDTEHVFIYNGSGDINEVSSYQLVSRQYLKTV